MKATIKTGDSFALPIQSSSIGYSDIRIYE